MECQLVQSSRLMDKSNNSNETNITSTRQHLFTINFTFVSQQIEFMNECTHSFRSHIQRWIVPRHCQSISIWITPTGTTTRVKNSTYKKTALFCCCSWYCLLAEQKIVWIQQNSQSETKNDERRRKHEKNTRQNYVKYVCSIKYDRTKQ